MRKLCLKLPEDLYAKLMEYSEQYYLDRDSAMRLLLYVALENDMLGKCVGGVGRNEDNNTHTTETSAVDDEYEGDITL